MVFAASLPPAEEIERNVSAALVEDIGPGDLTAGLIPADRIGRATVISREDAVLCGTAWFDRVFGRLDPRVKLSWQAADGDRITKDQLLCEIEGSARALLSAERSGLNFLQLLSGVATKARHYADVVAGTKAVVVDTRKTIPGLRLAQKYAVKCGGGDNHRIGLYDAILIKENHILAAGSIAAALEGFEGDWTEIARDLVRRRFGPAGPVDLAQRRKAADLLARRGFSTDSIRAATRFDPDE